MVQPLGVVGPALAGAGPALAGAGASTATVDPAEFNRLELDAWEAAAGSYGFLRKLTARANGSLLAAAGVARGLQVLDVGSGPGDLAAAAAALGADTVGIDVAPSMVRRAALANHAIPFRVGSFEAIPAGEGAFDAVLGGFVFNHVGSPEAALAEARRVLRPGGHLALATWDAPSRNRLLGLFVDALSAIGAPPPSGLPAGPIHFRSDDELRALFVAAGFAGVGVSRIMFEARVPDLDTLWDGVLDSGGQIPPTITRQPQAIRGAIRAAFDVLAEVHRRPDGYAIPVSMQIIAGRRP